MRNTNQVIIRSRNFTRSKPDDQTNRIFTKLPLLMRLYGWIIWKVSHIFSELRAKLDRIEYRPFTAGQTITLRHTNVAGYHDGTTFTITGFTESGDYRVTQEGAEQPHVEFADNIHLHFRLVPKS